MSCCKTSNIRRVLVGEIVDHTYIIGASPVGAATNYIFILNLTSGFNGLGKDKVLQDEKHLSVGILCDLR